MSQSPEYAGRQTQTTGQADYSALSFLIDQVMGGVAICKIVKVVAVTNTGGDVAAGTVDVLPLVTQMDGNGNPVPHETVYGLPYGRIYGGGNAVILDPQIGDIGIVVFADRDSSSVIHSQTQNTPGSGRRFSMSDGLYVCGILGGVPTQFVQFLASGIVIKSPSSIKLQAPDIQLIAPTVEITATTSVTVNSPQINLNGNITQTAGSGTGTATLVGPLTVTNDVVAGGKSLETHRHSAVTTGINNSGPPV